MTAAASSLKHLGKAEGSPEYRFPDILRYFGYMPTRCLKIEESLNLICNLPREEASNKVAMKAKDMRKGTVIVYKNAPHSVLEFHHRTPGNLRAFIQVKLRNLITSIQCEERFSSTEDIPLADVYNFQATYLYKDTTGYHFMNSESYEQLTMDDGLLGDSIYYLQEGMSVGIATYQEQPISISLPKTVTLTILETQPELRGATASNSPKPATCDTGLAITVPAFVKIGDKVIVDTDEGNYISRADD